MTLFRLREIHVAQCSWCLTVIFSGEAECTGGSDFAVFLLDNPWNTRGIYSQCRKFLKRQHSALKILLVFHDTNISEMRTQGARSPSGKVNRLSGVQVPSRTNPGVAISSAIRIYLC